MRLGTGLELRRDLTVPLILRHGCQVRRSGGYGILSWSAHRLKYRLFYGYPGRRAVSYDNERGKGDHRHRDGVEEPYVFESLGKLLNDFEADVEALRAEEGKHGE